MNIPVTYYSTLPRIEDAIEPFKEILTHSLGEAEKRIYTENETIYLVETI